MILGMYGTELSIVVRENDMKEDTDVLVFHVVPATNRWAIVSFREEFLWIFVVYRY